MRDVDEVPFRGGHERAAAIEPGIGGCACNQQSDDAAEVSFDCSNVQGKVLGRRRGIAGGNAAAIIYYRQNVLMYMWLEPSFLSLF